MPNIIVTGAAGRMGSRLVTLIKESSDLSLTAAIERPGHPAVGQDAGEVAGCGSIGTKITDDPSTEATDGAVVIDFSSPQATLAHGRTAAQSGHSLVIGTTGLSSPQLANLKTITQSVACVFSPNMSVGVNLLLKVLAEMAQALGEDYDIEVIEAHHRLKKDAPSGTALKMAQVLAAALHRDLEQVGVYARRGMIGERQPVEIGIQSIRAGDIVGDHTVLFGGMSERIEITHRAESRDTFARGALRAARWVAARPPGFYDMLDVLGLR